MATQTIRELLTTHLEKIKTAIIVNMAAKNRNASGRSVQSLQVAVDGNKAVLWGLSSYLVMERGRKPGRIPQNFRDIIKQWILDRNMQVTPINPVLTKSGNVRRNVKLSPYERGLNTMAGAIAHSIMVNGTRLHRTGGYDDIFTTAIDNELDLLNEEISRFAGYEIERIHQSSI